MIIKRTYVALRASQDNKINKTDDSAALLSETGWMDDFSFLNTEY